MGVSFVETNGDSVPWCSASKGSGRALQAAVDELSQKSGVSALRQAPLVMAGICEAGQFAYEFTTWQPERVRAFLTMGGGKHDVSLTHAGRRQNAPWIFAEEPMANYDRGKCSRLTANFLSAALGKPETLSSVALLPAVLPIENPTPDERGLSFVSKPLSKLGTITPLTVAMGVIDLEQAPEGCQAEFEVTTEETIHVKNISALFDPKELTCKTTQVGENKWRVECLLNPKTFPCGPFKMDVPIRFTDKDNQPIYGGISAVLTGRTMGDVISNPTTLNVGTIKKNTTKEVCLTLKSRSNRNIDLGGIGSSFPEWIRVEVVSNKGATAELRCKFAPPADWQGKGFSGYLWVLAKSKDGQVLKILFYGTIE